jgi:hypothetical protein
LRSAATPAGGWISLLELFDDRGHVAPFSCDLGHHSKDHPYNKEDQSKI